MKLQLISSHRRAVRGGGRAKTCLHNIDHLRSWMRRSYWDKRAEIQSPLQRRSHFPQVHQTEIWHTHIYPVLSQCQSHFYTLYISLEWGHTISLLHIAIPCYCLTLYPLLARNLWTNWSKYLQGIFLVKKKWHAYSTYSIFKLFNQFFSRWIHTKVGVSFKADVRKPEVVYWYSYLLWIKYYISQKSLNRWGKSFFPHYLQQ